MSSRKMSQADFEVLANFRYQLRRFLRFSERQRAAAGSRRCSTS
jgi:hypothetical protein